MIGAGKGRANALSEVSSKQVFFKSIDELFDDQWVDGSERDGNAVSA